MVSYKKFFKVEEDVEDELATHEPNYFLENIWDAPRVDMALVSETTLSDEIVEGMDATDFCAELSAWDLIPKRIVDGTLSEEEYKTFNDFIDYKVRNNMSIVAVICRVIDCSKLEFDDVDYKKLVCSIDEKNMDLLRLEKAVRNGNKREIEHSASLFIR